MRIGLVIDEFDPLRGGAEQWTFQHATQLLQRGYEVHVVAGSFGPAAMKLPFRLHAFGRIPSRLKRAAAVEGILRGLGLDIVHDIGTGWYSDVLQSEDGSRFAQWEQMLQTLPPLVRPIKRWMLQTLPRYHEFRELMRQQFSDPNRIIVAVSQMCAADYERWHGVERERIRVVYHGTDTIRFSPRQREVHREPVRQQLGIRQEDVVFLFVGHDFVRKGLATALHAVKSLLAKDLPARLIVAGGPHGRPRRTIGKSSDANIYTGRVADAVPLYAAADVFVLPTYYDPCSLSVGEAAASGLPIVTTRFNGASELITNDREGFILDDPADARLLSERLELLLDPARRAEMGQAARRMAEAFNMERNCEEILAVYREILRNRNSSSSVIRRAA